MSKKFKKKSNFEIIYATIVKIEEEVKDKNEMEKIILCEVQNKIYPNIEKIFLNLLKDSGYPFFKIEKKLILKNYTISKKLIKIIFF